MKLFKKVGWIYFPITITGSLISICAIMGNVWFFIAIDRNSHSVSDTLISLLPYLVSIWVIYGFIASNCSGNDQKLKKNEKININASRQLRKGDGIDSYAGTPLFFDWAFFWGIFLKKHNQGRYNS